MRRTSGLLMLAAIFTLAFAVPHIALANQESNIPSGTVITIKNWRKYKQYMPYGMQLMWEGKYYWKFPANFQMVVGPTHHYAAPATYQQNTEKYASKVRIVDLPDGGHSLSGYVAGRPFPNPTAPLKGWKILVDEWFRYIPYLMCSARGGLQNIIEDRFGNRTVEINSQVYRRLSHISDYNYLIADPKAQGVDYSEWVQVMQPEQSKYTTNLALYYDNLNRSEDIFLFIPSLRRSLRLSAAARCSPFVGTDWTQDDTRTGFNGGIVRWDAKFLRNQKVLTITSAAPSLYGNWSNYYPRLLWPKPIIGKYDVRPVDVIDVRRIPSQRAGYCYGKRIMYIDRHNFNDYWNDLYDSGMKFWKGQLCDHIASPVPHEGMQAETGNFIQAIYDQQNEHMTVAITVDEHGQGARNNSDCDNFDGHDFNNVFLYSMPGGLAQILR